MKRWIIYIALFIIIIPFSCKKDAEISPTFYPVVIIDKINEISDSGLIITAKILSFGNDTILEYGFVWNTAQEPKIDNFMLSFAQRIEGDNYSGIIDNNLSKDKKYWIRPYIKLKDYIVYGSSTQFLSRGCLPPVIESFDPHACKIGSSVKIKIRHINEDPARTTIMIDNMKVTIIDIDQNEVTVNVPFSTTASAAIKVVSGGLQSAGVNTITIINPWIRLSWPITISAYPVVCSINGKGYFCGSKLWEFEPDSSAWLEKKTIPKEWRMNYDAVASSLGNKGYFGLGLEHWYGNPLSDFWEYDPVTDDWKRLADFPGLGVVHPQCLDINGKILIGLGRSKSSSFSDMWSYDPVSDSWTRKNNAPISDDGTNYSFVVGNTVYIGSGKSRKLYAYNPEGDTWVYLGLCPDSESSSVQSAIACTIDGDIFILISYNSFSNIWKYLRDTNEWVLHATIPLRFIQCFSVGKFGYLYNYNTYEGLYKFEP